MKYVSPFTVVFFPLPRISAHLPIARFKVASHERTTKKTEDGGDGVDDPIPHYNDAEHPDSCIHNFQVKLTEKYKYNGGILTEHKTCGVVH